MMLVPLRVPPALAQRRVALRISRGRAALDEIGKRLARRAGDVDAGGAQVRDHARAGLRGEQGRGLLAARLPAAARTLGKLRHPEQLERHAQLRELGALARLEPPDDSL